MFSLIIAVSFRIESLNFIIFRHQCQTMDLDTYSYLISTDYLSRNWIPTALYDQNYSCKFCKCNKMNYHWRLAVAYSLAFDMTNRFCLTSKAYNACNMYSKGAPQSSDDLLSNLFMSLPIFQTYSTYQNKVFQRQSFGVGRRQLRRKICQR